jgi:hypothetical protein
MSLVMMEGFEATVDQSDLTSQKGWLTSQATNLSGNTSVGIPSRTGIAGTGLMLRGPYSSSAALPMASASAPDFGMNALNETVYAAWQSGGFSVGINATFNKVKQVEIGGYYPNQLVFDGNWYWAVGTVNGSGTPGIFYSTDLQNWTQLQTNPTGLAFTSWIQVIGSGATAAILTGDIVYDSDGAPYNRQTGIYYSTNLGVTWTAMAGGGGQQQWFGGCATGNSATPFLFLASYANAYNYAYVWGYTSGNSTTTIGGTGRNLSGSVITSSNYYSGIGIARKKQNFVCIWMQSVSAASWSQPPGTTAQLPNNALATDWVIWNAAAGAFSTANATYCAAIPNFQFDICYCSSLNLWVSVGGGGIYTAPDSASASAPAGPTAAWANPVPATNIWSVDTNGSIIVAVGQDPLNANLGAIWVTTNGVTWTKTNRFIGSSSQAVTGFTSVFWDGSRFVMTGHAGSNLIAVSTDGTAWTVVYHPDYTEQTVSNAASLLGVYAGIGGSSYTPWSTASSQYVGVGVLPAAQTGTGNATARVVTPYLIEGNGTPVAQTPTISVPTSGGYSHFYEFIFTSVPGSANQFTVQYAIDAGIIGSLNGGAPIQLAGSGDTGQAQLFVNLPRNGQFTVVDDAYVTNNTSDAAGAQGQLGVINIINDPFLADSQDQFSTSNSAVSHAALMNVPFSNSEGYIYSTTQGQTDIYTTNPTIPANYRVQAVMVEGYFQKYSGAGANGAVGVKSGSATATGSQGAGTGFGTGYSQLIQTTDPSSGAAWTAAGLQAMKVTVTKTT